jgi:DNA polymerase-3 subunit epsilon
VREHEYTVVDVETTGLYWRSDRIVAVAAARCDDAGHLIDRWSTLVNPQRPVAATEIHGLTDEALCLAPTFGAIADELLHLLGGTVVVGHNVSFDWRFLDGEFARHGDTLPDHDGICTMTLARDLGLDVPNSSLEAVAAYCGVALPRKNYHDALEDVLATAGIFSQLYPLVLQRGIDPIVHLRQEWPPALHKAIKCPYVNPGLAQPGQPLIQGMHIVITGETATPREELFTKAIAAGLDVTGSVTAKTSLLVANDLACGTNKARAALSLATPVVDEAMFLALLGSVAPGTPREQLHHTANRRREARIATRAKDPSARAKAGPYGPLAGRRVLLIGQFPNIDGLEELVSHSGGIVSHNVSRNTNLVVVGTGHDERRLTAAVGYGAEVVSEPELLRRLHIGEDLAVSDQLGAEASELTEASLGTDQFAEAGTGSNATDSAVTGEEHVVDAQLVSTAPVQLPPAAWYPDPTGRFQFRYWDGATWTVHVSSNGQTYLDPFS